MNNFSRDQEKSKEAREHETATVISAGTLVATGTVVACGMFGIPLWLPLAAIGGVMYMGWKQVKENIR